MLAALDVDLSCPLIITVLFDYVALRSNHSVCIVVVLHDSVTIFICLVLEQYHDPDNVTVSKQAQLPYDMHSGVPL